MRIVVDDLGGPEIRALVALHLGGMHQHSPARSVHALDLTGLADPAVTMWSAWGASDLLGCGAMKAIGGGQGEIKSMRVHPDHLRKGVGAALLRHIIGEARQRGYARLYLETGTAPAFDPALAMYGAHGFTACAPFADYREDPFSRFMTLAL